MGYHIGSLINHFFAKKKANDYVEMMFHHIVTAYLYAYSYMSCCLIGAIVSLIHDITDIFVSFTRATSESKLSALTAYSFIVA